MIRITYRTSQGELVSCLYQRTIEHIARRVIVSQGHEILRIEEVGA